MHFYKEILIETNKELKKKKKNKESKKTEANKDQV